MAAARSFWKGHLRLALVTIPIRLVSATASEDKIALHQVDRKTKQRIRYQKVAGEGGRVVPQADIVQGYELDDGNYVLFEPDELDKLKLNTRHTVELTEFVDACSIDPLYFDNPYYVLPDGDVAEEGYRIIRDALRATEKYGVGQLTIRGRENLVAMKPCGNGLMLETLRYANEIRDADEIFSGIGSSKLRPELVNMAKQLIDERTRKFEPSDFKNHYSEALRALVKEKVEGGLSTEVAGGGDEPSGGTVIDFMEALRRSTGKSKAKPTNTRTKTAAARQKREPVKRAPPKAQKRKSRGR
ncbi:MULTISPECIES: Ku protein [unclassified Hyphomicrobium]|uniref:non-homologous end joining protein Ku n=1 Tax=unclassified Hyphomicrobium TaxID=2619925 RepID=UPI000213D5D4|nr:MULTISPECIES: Ku protein [unclassified Hyphomicrobium]CCB65652.1 putative DNA repair protein Hden_1068 [Hyphomicrobium sp. MC1]